MNTEVRSTALHSAIAQSIARGWAVAHVHEAGGTATLNSSAGGMSAGIHVLLLLLSLGLWLPFLFIIELTSQGPRTMMIIVDEHGAACFTVTDARGTIKASGAFGDPITGRTLGNGDEDREKST